MFTFSMFSCWNEVLENFAKNRPQFYFLITTFITTANFQCQFLEGLLNDNPKTPSQV